MVTIYLFLFVTNAAVTVWERLRGGGNRAANWRTTVFRNWARLTAAVVGMRVELQGSPPVPPFFLVANHLSYLDVLLLAGQLHGVFVSKAEVREWPFIGAVCRSVDTLFIDRGSKRDIPRVMARMEQVLEQGRGVVVFPEGTSSMGRNVERFKPGLLDAPTRLSLPVSYAGLSYRTPAGSAPAHLAVCWWGDAGFASHVWGVLRLPGFTARIAFGERPILETDRKVLAERLRAAVESEFEPVVPAAGASDASWARIDESARSR